MSESKTPWTPGPWTLDACDDYEDGTDMEVLDQSNFPVASIEGRPILNRWSERFPQMDHWAIGAGSGLTQTVRSQEELLANARLIAAAPALVEALERVAGKLAAVAHADGVDWEAEDLLTEARAALSLARGDG